MIYVTIVTMINKTMINMTMINMTMTNMTMIKHDHAQRDYDIRDDADPRRPCRHLLLCTSRWSPLTAGDSGHSKDNLTSVLRTAQSKSTLPPKPKKQWYEKEEIFIKLSDRSRLTSPSRSCLTVTLNGMVCPAGDFFLSVFFVWLRCRWWALVVHF